MKINAIQELLGAKVLCCEDNSLSDVTLENGVEYIDNNAFGECFELTEIKIPESISLISGDPFSGCTGLESISVDKTSLYYSDVSGVLFDKELNTLVRYPCAKEGTEYIIPTSVTEIGASAFDGCGELIYIGVPQGVTYIGEQAFNYCLKLKSIEIPDGVTAIEDATFLGCVALESIDIPDSVTRIGALAFGKCTGLKEITIPDSVTDIRSESIIDCGDIVIKYRGETYSESKFSGLFEE